MIEILCSKARENGRTRESNLVALPTIQHIVAHLVLKNVKMQCPKNNLERQKNINKSHGPSSLSHDTTHCLPIFQIRGF